MSSPILQPPALLPQRLFATPLVNDKGMVQADGVWGRIFQLIPKLAKIPQFQQGSHALRMATSAASFPDGSIFKETDRSLYYVAAFGKWLYLGGILSITQATLPADLTANDFGLLAYITDYDHLLRWAGAGWTWAPGDSQSDFIVAFNDPAGPEIPTGWQACDGSINVTKLKSDGTFDYVTVPTIAGSWYRR